MAPRLRRRSRSPAGRTFGRPSRRCRACCSGPKRRSPIPLEDARTDEHQALAHSSARARPALLGPSDRAADRRHRGRSHDGIHVDGAANSIFVLGPGGRILGRYDKAHLVPLWRISADAAAAVRDRPVAARAGRRRLHARPGPAHASILAAAGARSASRSATRSSSRARSSIAQQPARLHLQPLERRLVRPLGPAAASRPGAAARGRGRPAGAPLDPDRDQRGDRCAAATSSKSLPWRTAGVIDAVLPPPANSPTPVRALRQYHPASARLRCSSSAALRWAASRR